MLAVGAPQTSTQEHVFAGRLSVYDVQDACRETQRPGGPDLAPPVVFERHGVFQGQLLGVDTAYTPGSLAIVSKGFLLNHRTPGFEEAPASALPRTYPLSVAGDLTGDGKQELLAGPLEGHRDRQRIAV